MINNILVLLLVLVIGVIPENTPEDSNEAFRSPVEIKYSDDGQFVASTDFTKGTVYLIKSSSGQIVKEVKGLNQPFGLVWISEDQIAVSEYGDHVISIIDIKKGKVIERIDCVKYPMGIELWQKNKILVSGFGKSEVGLVDLQIKKQVEVVPVWYQPNFIEVNSVIERAFISNLTPKDAKNGAKVSMLDLKDFSFIKDIELPFGSTNLRQIICSPDGNWVYVLHTYGKVTLPTSQLEKGWVATNVLSILDAKEGKLYATLPFDQTTIGAADPWGLTLSADGSKMYVTLAGVHHLAVLKIGEFHEYLSGQRIPEGLRQSDANASIASNIWNDVHENPSKRLLLADQLSALYAAGLLERIDLPVTGPRGIDIAKDNETLAISGYYSGDIAFVDLKNRRTVNTLSLGNEPELTLAREGEILFHDASSTFQGWLSCVTCHPAGRADGLNWDLLNDGIGNPKNAKSLLLSHATPPSMSTGIRSNYEVAVKAGFHFIKFVNADEQKYNAVKAYLSNMKPDPSPYLENGLLSVSAERGKQLFHSNKAGCFNCHSGEYLTDQKIHNIGTKGKYDRTDTFDTPTLIEAWRTAPYLHDGSVSSLEELFMNSSNTGLWHGFAMNMNENELLDLIQYVKSL